MISQDFGTKYENVQPYATPSWIGNIELTPSVDSWFDTETLPKINNNAMGTYDTVLAANKNSLGTIYNADGITSTGVTTATTQDWSVGYEENGYTETVVETSIDTTTKTTVTAGVTNTLVEDIVVQMILLYLLRLYHFVGLEK